MVEAGQLSRRRRKTNGAYQGRERDSFSFIIGHEVQVMGEAGVQRRQVEAQVCAAPRTGEWGRRRGQQVAAAHPRACRGWLGVVLGFH